MEIWMGNGTFTERLASQARPVVVDFWAPWCAPCRWIAPAIERLEAEYAGRVEVWKVNADDDPEAARALGVVWIPTLVAFHAGKEIARKVGAGSEGDLRGIFEAARLGEKPARTAIAPLDRLLRLAAGSAILVVGFANGPSALLLALGGVVLFTAVADRCPIWQAIRPRLASLFRRRDAATR
jgi:thioredoxin 1